MTPTTVTPAILLAALLCAAPAAALLTDPTGDVTLAPSPVGTPLPIHDAVDLVAVALTDDHAGLHATITVKDLSATNTTQYGVFPDTMWIVMWGTDYANPTGAAARQGSWSLRADFQPQNDNPWSFSLERPCLDGRDSDGCSGDDRDIIDGLEGHANFATSTITINAPWAILASPEAGDAIGAIRATGQMVWPSYPVYAVDWDTDEQPCYTFQTPEPQPQREAATQHAGQGTGSMGRYGEPAAAGEAQCRSQETQSQGTPRDRSGSESRPQSNADETQSQQDTDDQREPQQPTRIDPAGNSLGHNVPGPGIVLVLLGFLIAGRR